MSYRKAAGKSEKQLTDIRRNDIVQKYNITGSENNGRTRGKNNRYKIGNSLSKMGKCHKDSENDDAGRGECEHEKI